MQYAVIIAFSLTQVMMFLAWLCYCYTKNPGIVDVFWSIVIAAVATLFMFVHGAAQHPILYTTISLVLLWAWALRLSIFLLLTRIIPRHIEHRYDVIKRKTKGMALFLFFQYQLQGVLACVLGSVFYVVKDGPNYPALFFIAAGFSVLAILGEAQADLQLYRFRRSSHGLQIMQQGWWAFSRHPNCFFEWCIWLGFGLLCCSFSLHFWPVMGPLLMYVIMRHMTIPVTERASHARRGALYAEYSKKTPCFWPKIPRK